MLHPGCEPIGCVATVGILKLCFPLPTDLAVCGVHVDERTTSLVPCANVQSFPFLHMFCCQKRHIVALYGTPFPCFPLPDAPGPLPLAPSVVAPFPCCSVFCSCSTSPFSVVRDFFQWSIRIFPLCNSSSCSDC